MRLRNRRVTNRFSGTSVTPRVWVGLQLESLQSTSVGTVEVRDAPNLSQSLFLMSSFPDAYLPPLLCRSSPRTAAAHI